MGYSEFIEWVAFYEVEPFGETRGDLNTALLAATIANANRAKKSKPVKVAQFLIDWWKDARNPRALLAKFQAAIAQNSGEAQKVKNGTRLRNVIR